MNKKFTTKQECKILHTYRVVGRQIGYVAIFNGLNFIGLSKSRQGGHQFFNEFHWDDLLAPGLKGSIQIYKEIKNSTLPKYISLKNMSDEINCTRLYRFLIKIEKHLRKNISKSILNPDRTLKKNFKRNKNSKYFKQTLKEKLEIIQKTNKQYEIFKKQLKESGLSVFEFLRTCENKTGN